MARRKPAIRRLLPGTDAGPLITATAIVHHLALLTRNTADFEKGPRPRLRSS